jgi:ABC-2 type transport system permease protein
MVAGLSNRPKSSVSMASSVLLVTFTLSFLVNLNEGLDFLKYLTPFKYYEANVLFNSMKFDPVYLLLSGIIIVVAITTTYLSYNRRDLKV